LGAEELAGFLGELPHWSVVPPPSGGSATVAQVERDFPFLDFVSGLRFLNRAAEIAEEENHHPELTLSWGHVVVRIWTHTAKGVTEADVILAAKYERLFERDFS